MTTLAAPAASTRPQAIPWLLAGATVLSEIANPLLSGQALAVLTVVTVALFAAASASHVLLSRGGQDCLRMLAITLGVGFAAEAVGVRTGVPFGHYAYTPSLGAQALRVPLVIPFAWAMMAWPALVVGRAIGRPVLAGAVALASWDLFLDPQMVHDGYWQWNGPGPTVNDIPVVNTLGWLLVALLLLWCLDRALPVRGGPERSRVRHTDERLPLALWLWTFGSSILANVAFFQRPLVALVGGVGMGVVALPLIRGLTSAARRP